MQNKKISEDMLLSIVTINRNNMTGLEKTMRSVLSQTSSLFEYVVVDGASTDGSVGIIESLCHEFGDRIKWVSEPDSGIYNAMNKGIRMASGIYIQILNSGDCLFSVDVVERMLIELERNDFPHILYGNEVKQFPDGRKITDKSFAGKEISMLGFYSGSLNHDSAYIQRELFEKYGYYDESLKIVSDWKWFLQAIIFGEEIPVYTNIDMTIDDMTGISETNLSLRFDERDRVLITFLPAPLLADYEKYHFLMNQMDRLKRHPWAYGLVWFLERILFKIEKWRVRITGITSH